MKILLAIATTMAVLTPAEGRAEAFSSYWSTLDESERDFVDQLAAGLYREERGRRADDYSSLNVASKARLRARAVEALGVKNRPPRSNKKGADI